MSQLAAYLDFVRAKVPQAESLGFEPPSPCHASLFPHQRELAEWMVRGGRRANFSQFGLGKTRIHLQVAQWVTEQTGKPFLIVCPLGVRQEFTRNDGPAMGLAPKFIRTTGELDGSRIYVTNYESVRDGKINLKLFAGAGLDEASVLRSFGSKIYQEFLPQFRAIPYRFVFTATPSPNRYKELIHYAGFLGVMDTGEALTRFFQRDSSHAGNLTLYPHMERQFWHWLASWAAFLSSPADLGHDATGYDLPPLQVHWHQIDVDHSQAWGQADSRGQAALFLDQAIGLKQAAESKRASITARVAKAAEIIEAGRALADDRDVEANRWIIWHDLEAERHAIQKAIPWAKSVWGSQPLDEREDLIVGFGNGEFPILSTKPVIAGSGCNFQRFCHRAVFLGVGYKFNDFIQAIHRIHRFQQSRVVEIHIVYLESESAIKDELEAKWRRHAELVSRMAGLIRSLKLNSTDTMELIRSYTVGDDRAEASGEQFRLIHNDCVPELMTHPADSVDAIVTSIPFGNQYEYSPSFNDFGHNLDNEAFFEQFTFLAPELLRILKPGRVACLHVKDRIRFGNVTGDGFPVVDRFSDKTADAMEKAGFRLLARITIDTDVVRENNQTYRLGWSENAKDSSKMGAGMPEYVLVFRKRPTDRSNGYADLPVTKSKNDYTRADWQLDAAGLWRSNGNRLPEPESLRTLSLEELKRLWTRHCLNGGYSFEEHVALAKALEEQGKLPSSFMLFPPVSRNKDIWTDIARMRTLNTEQSRRQQEQHVCPLQLDIIKRLITRYTNPGELVLDPFMGIGSTAWQAIQMGRRALGVELNRGYWATSVGYAEAAEAELATPTLFDLPS